MYRNLIYLVSFLLALGSVSNAPALGQLSDPYPPDGATSIPLNVTLRWEISEEFDWQEVYLGTNYDDVYNARDWSDEYESYLDAWEDYYEPGGLEPGTTYYWKIAGYQQVGEFIIVSESSVWEFTTGLAKATNPYPANGATDVDPNVVLSWTPGCMADVHDVYLGTNFDEVANANTTTTGIYRGCLYTHSYDPGTLEPGTDYYWRTDEVNNLDPDSPWKGNIWSFTTALAAELLVFYQMDFNLSGTIYTDTEWGSVDFTFTGQEPIMYFNLNVNGTWQVQNIPVLSIEGVGVEQTMTYYFDLGTARGTNVTSLSYDYAFTPSILDTMPGVLKPVSVVDDYVAMWPGFGGLMPSLGPARPLIGGEVVSSDKKHAHKNFPNQECSKMECVPAAVSNSLQFLNRENNLGLEANDISIDTMKKATGWDPNGAPLYTWWEIKKKYMEDNGYPITTRKITDMNELAAEIDAGQDVEIIESWLTDANDPNSITGHATALIGITPLKNGKYSLDVADDRKQGKPGGCDKPRPYTYDPKTGTIDEAGYITKFEYAVVECPMYILLDDFELYDDTRGLLAVWTDGRSAAIIPDVASNGTGSLIQLTPDPTNPDNQCMMFDYANGVEEQQDIGYFSQVELTFEDPQDWVQPDTQAVSFRIIRDPCNIYESVYLGLEDSDGISAQAYAPFPFVLPTYTWETVRFGIDQFYVAGVDLRTIQKITIGVGNPNNTSTPGSAGIVFIDDIKLETAPSGPKLRGDLNCDGTVNMLDLVILAYDWLKVGGKGVCCTKDKEKKCRYKVSNFEGQCPVVLVKGYRCVYGSCVDPNDCSPNLRFRYVGRSSMYDEDYDCLIEFELIDCAKTATSDICLKWLTWDCLADQW